MYACYELSESSKKLLLSLYPPANSDVKCDHITIKFGVNKDYPLPKTPKSVKVIGHLSVEGLDAFLVSVNGSTVREDDSYYHITISVDPAIHKPKDTNDFIKDSKLVKSIVPAISINVTPEIKN